MKRTHTYQAEDGTTFATARECKLHEEMGHLRVRLSRLDFDEVQDALDRKNIPRADAIERAGSIIARKRRESGDVKIRRKHRPEGQLESAAAAMDKIKENMKAIS
jgi:hypothetical protein